VSDKYLDAFYGQFTRIKDGGRWSAHGNSGLFQANTGILEMQMDTLSYNETEALLIANELKLGGKKNPDQILKYALMFKLLRERKFIVPHARFVLLFIGGAKADPPWKALLEEEVSFCKNSPKETARAVCQPEVIEIAKSAEYASTSWSELITFNEAYRRKLDPKAQQVEDNLLWGFNESLKEKEFMQRNAGTTKVSVEHGHGAAKSKRRERLGGKLVRTQGDTAIGQSEGAREQKVRSSPGRSPVRLNRETFLNSCPPESREFFTNVLDDAEKRGLRVLWASESFLIHKKEQVLDFFRCKIAGYLELFIRDVPEKLHSELVSLPAATKSSRFVIKIPVTSETLSDAEKAWNLALQTVFD
jgi:hypothetical protein